MSFSKIMTGLAAQTDFYFLRHGESQGNIEGRMQGHEDRDLTDLGRRQARYIGEWFEKSEIRIGSVLSSPLRRALETARIVSEGASYPPPQAIDSAKELDTGLFTGLSFREIKERYPDEYARFLVGSWEAVPKAERITSLIGRALETWRAMAEIANAQNGGAILTVTHGGMIQWIVKSSFGATIDQPVPWMPLVLASNCSIFHFRARPVLDIDGGHWYYGQWSLMNHTPGYDSSDAAQMREQFYTDASKEESQVR